ncbi:HNH endonuclease, partial [Luteimicrobium sp. DT211]
GPIPADLARRLATGQDVTWQRIVTDPVTGIAADVSRRTYRPGTVLGDLVRVRDATCTFPGCGIPAWRADLDHVEPFDHTRAGDRSSGDGTVSDTG